MSDQGVFGRLLGRLRPGTSGDAGSGKLEDYDYNLRPKNRNVTIRLADSDQHRDELQSILDLGADEVWAMISRRNAEDERTDAPMPVRLFVSGRVSGVVGIVPRGLEAPVDDALVRLAESGKPPRIPAAIVAGRAGLRADLLIGETR